MNDEHIKEIVKKMPDLFNPTAIQESVENYLEEHPINAKSAYEQAVDGGYTGTREEFEQALANIDTDPSDIDFSDIEGVI